VYIKDQPESSAKTCELVNVESAAFTRLVVIVTLARSEEASHLESGSIELCVNDILAFLELSGHSFLKNRLR
jgi:hypothetical protein